MDAGWDIFCQVIEPPLVPREKIESAKGKGKKKVHVTRDQRQMVMAHWPTMVELGAFCIYFLILFLLRIGHHTDIPAADILSTVHHNKSFEHPLYFVSQMYMREWEIREVYSYKPFGYLSTTTNRTHKTTNTTNTTNNTTDKKMIETANDTANEKTNETTTKTTKQKTNRKTNKKMIEAMIEVN